MVTKNVMIEHEVYGTWYFTTVRGCSKFLDCAEPQISRVINHPDKSYKDWKVVEVDNLYDVPSAFIDPHQRGINRVTWIEEQNKRIKELMRAVYAEFGKSNG